MKFNNQRVKHHAGYSFASKLEASVFDLLKILEGQGKIRHILTQNHVKLTRAEIVYIPDFKVIDCETELPFWIEAKGFETPEWRIKRRLWKHYGPGPLHIYRAGGQWPKLFEIIIPEGE